MIVGGYLYFTISRHLLYFKTSQMTFNKNETVCWWVTTSSSSTFSILSPPYFSSEGKKGIGSRKLSSSFALKWRRLIRGYFGFRLRTLTVTPSSLQYQGHLLAALSSGDMCHAKNTTPLQLAQGDIGTTPTIREDSIVSAGLCHHTDTLLTTLLLSHNDSSQLHFSW